MPYNHPTKGKGDRGLGEVIADLLRNGLQVALPLSEHLPFDLIVISNDGDLRRLSVKSRKIKRDPNKNGSISVPLSNTGGKYNKGDVDCFAVFCPDTNQCYYIRIDEITGSTSFALRVDEPSKSNATRVRWATDFIDPNRLYSQKGDVI